MVQTTRTFKLSVGTTVVQLCAENPSRVLLWIVNNGTDTVYILSAQNQEKEDGFPIYSKGSHKNQFSQSELWIIAESGTQDVRVMVVS